MKPLVVDTSVWVHWLRGEKLDKFEEAKARTQHMPAIVALELTAGVRERNGARAVMHLIESFRRGGRLLIPIDREFERAGETLADLSWPASKKSNDVLIAILARRIGAEVWTADEADFRPVARALGLTVTVF